MSFCLEDPYQKEKIDGMTRIPNGISRLSLTKAGKSYKRYFTEKGYRWAENGIIVLNKVPGFTGIQIHPLNKSTQTEGCLGPNFVWDAREDTMSQSVAACEMLYNKVTPFLREEGDHYIEVCELVNGKTIYHGK